MAISSLESCLPFVAFLDPDLIIYIFKIDFAQDCNAVHAVYNFANQG